LVRVQQERRKCQYRIAAIAADCKPALIGVRRFESYCWHKLIIFPNLLKKERYGKIINNL